MKYFVTEFNTKVRRLRNKLRYIALIPLVLFTRLLLLVPSCPLRSYDMSVDGWNRHGTELFRLYAYVFDVAIICVVITLCVLRHCGF